MLKQAKEDAAARTSATERWRSLLPLGPRSLPRNNLLGSYLRCRPVRLSQASKSELEQKASLVISETDALVQHLLENVKEAC